MNGNKAAVKLLLADKRVDVNQKGLEELTALSWAAAMGHEAVVQLLLAAEGINVESRSAEPDSTLLGTRDGARSCGDALTYCRGN
ncbi:hypothetical protein P167DRAFT_531607 [Morchella conica CCBAS932]|uniref:Uncharacterized protein n=2 Tax=Morchella sect. Distantes TaxID=1051054 RepID=A0A3N4L7B6_9PEZI|nr:hypothetical protein P167DRAFT_531607 [Morchella conica CCBAS932]